MLGVIDERKDRYDIRQYKDHFKGRHDIQHNLAQHNDTKHKGLIYDTQHTWHSALMTLSITTLGYYSGCCYAECQFLFVVMLGFVMLRIVMLSVAAPF